MIKTKRLMIQPYESSDLFDLYQMLSDKELTYPAGFKPVPTLEVCRLSLQYRIVSKQYMKITTLDNQLIGEINFYKDETRKNPKAYEIGFILKKEYQHQGLMQETLMNFIPWFNKIIDIDILTTHLFSDNFKSENTLKALNFHYDGTIRHYKKMYDEKIFDCKEYTLTKDEIERNIELWQQKY